MIVQGSANPLPIWIRYIDEDNNTIVKLTRNVIEKSITNEITNDTKQEYEYEEIDVSILNRDNLQEYIETNFDAIFEKGLSDYEFKKQLEEKERQIKDLIDNHKLLEVNNELKNYLVDLQFQIDTVNI